MSTTRKIAQNTGSQLIGKIISTTLGLLAIGMMTRYLGQEQFGWYVTTIAFLQFIAILVDFGLIPVTAQMMGEKKIEEHKLLQNLLGYRFLTAIFFLGLTPLIALLFPYPTEVKIAIAFTTISMLSVAMNQIFMGYYQAKLKMHIQAISEIIGRIFLVTGLGIMIWLQKGFIPVMIVITVSSVAYTAVMWWSAIKYNRPTFAFDMEIWKQITIKMWPIAISIIFNVMYLKGDTVLLSIFSDQATVGIYGAAYRVIDILAQMAMLIMGIMLPLLAHEWTINNREKFHHFFQQSFDIMMVLAVPLIVGGAVLATPIMIFVAGKDFASSGPILALLLLGIFGLYIGAIFGHMAVAIDKQKQTMWIYISNAIITIIGYLIFIPRYGMWGATSMTLFSETYAGVMLYLIIRRYIKMKLDIKAFAKIIFSSLVMGSVLIILKALPVLLLIPIGGTVYVLFLLGLGGMSRQTVMDIIRVKKE